MNRLFFLLILLIACLEVQSQCAVAVDNAQTFCNGDATGELFASATGTPPFSYQWSHGATDSIASGLIAGTYTVTVTDADNCTAIGTGNVTEPNPLELTFTSLDALCNGGCTGEIDLTVSGGITPFSYGWSDGWTTEDRSDLCAGIYSVTITDANGCTEEVSVEILEPSSLNLDVQDVDLSCLAGESVMLTADLLGGTPGYSYQWSTGETSQSITVSPSVTTTYSVFVTDANGCSAEAQGTVTVGMALNANLEVKNLDCDNGTTFEITAFNQGDDGNQQYDFVWSGPGLEGATSSGNTDVRTDLGPGVYAVTITDNLSGCSGEDSVEVVLQQPLSVTNVVNRPTCFGECDGFLQFDVVGGAAPYTYLWPVPGNGSASRTLCAGAQSVTITDSYGCELIHDFVIEENPEMMLSFTTTDPLCGGECDGRIDPVLAGGTSPFSYAWSNGQATAQANGLCSGDYSLTVTDDNGCTIEGTATITNPAPLIIDVAVSGGECDPDGGPFSVDVNVTGGTSPYLYTWSDGSNLPMIPEGMAYSDYFLTVTDGLGCIDTIGPIRNYNRIQDFQGARIPRQSCEAPTQYFAPIPDGWSQAVILPNGDTLSGPDIFLTEFGQYRYLGFSPDNSCLQTGNFTVFSIDQFLNDDLRIVEVDSSSCGAFNCLLIAGLPGALANYDPFIINWFAPDGSLLVSNQSTEYCGVSSAGTYTAQIIAGCDTVATSISVDEIIPCSAIIGNVYAEEDVNCQLDQDDQAAPDVLIRFTDVTTGAVYYEISDAFGGFVAVLPVATYSITPLVNGMPPEDGCAPIMVTTITILPQTVELFLPAITNCPAMETWICMFQQRRCFENNMAVYYYNPTAEVVENVVVTVEMDPFYTNISSSIPIADQVGQTLTFNIGTVQPFQRTYFWLYFTISCEAELGQTHCVRSIVSPNAICEDFQDWNGALVNIDELTCDGDSITFRVENIGDELMSVPLSYVVVEDGIMMSRSPIETNALGPNDVFELRLPATGSTYQVRTNQEPNAPVDVQQPSFVLEGCGTGPGDGSNFGLANFFELGNGVPWEDYVCRQNTGSYDPNDKRGFPLGFRGGQIEPGTRIDYDIRFQNTGTDTAFLVVIRDTLETSLDLSTIKIEGGSHPFTVDIDSNRALTFTFADIMLPDSNVNLLESQGVVSFSIDHDPSLAPGDAIDNQAAIYFDFNEPIITNLSHHEIATESLPNAVRRIEAQQVAVSLSPNPVSGILKVDIPMADLRQDDLLEIRDLYGRRVLSSKYQLAAPGWNVHQLTPGYYVVILTDAAGRAKGRAGFIKME
ncbi:MAG: hypothetical protein AB8H12_15245 [Lewinella sp.]